MGLVLSEVLAMHGFVDFVVSADLLLVEFGDDESWGVLGTLVAMVLEHLESDVLPWFLKTYKLLVHIGLNALEYSL